MTTQSDKRHQQRLRLLLGGASLALVAGSIYFLFFRPLPAWRAIPPLAHVAWSVPNAPAIAELADGLGLASLALEFGVFDSLQRAWSVPRDRPLWLVAERAERDKLSSMAIFSTPSGWQAPLAAAAVQSFRFQGVEVYILPTPTQTVYWAQYRGLLLVAGQAFLLEEALETSRRSWYSSYEGPDHSHTATLSWHLNLHQWLSAGTLHGLSQAAGHGWINASKGGEGKSFSRWEAPWEAATGWAAELPWWTYVAGTPEQVATYAPKPSEMGQEWKQTIAPWLAYPLLEAKYQDKVLWILPTRDMAKAKRLLEQADPRSTAYPYLNFSIREIRVPGLFAGLGAESTQSGWWMSVDEVVICSQDRAVLEAWADYYLVGATLDKEPAFVEAASQTKDGLIAWMRAGALEELIQAYLPGWQAPSWFQAHSSFSLGLSGKELVLLGHKAFGSELARSWRYELNSPVQSWKPVRSTQQQVLGQIAVQGQNGWLHLLRSDGQAQWRIQLPEALLSDVYQLDQMVKGKIFYLFNTASEVYLLDEQGNRQDRLQLQLSAPATAGLLAVDTSGVGGYALYLPSANNRLNGWSIDGVPLKGWSPHPIALRCLEPMQYHAFPLHTFISATDTAGVVHVFDKYGQERFFSGPATEDRPVGGWQATLSPDPEALRRSRLVACAPNGKLKVLNFLGEGFPLAAASGDATNANTQPVRSWQIAHIGGDERAEYLLLRGEQLDVWGYKDQLFNKLQSIALPPGSTEAGYLSVDKNKAYLFALNTREAKLYLSSGQFDFRSAKELPAERVPMLLPHAAGQTILATVFKGVVYGFKD